MSVAFEVHPTQKAVLSNLPDELLYLGLGALKAGATKQAKIFFRLDIRNTTTTTTTLTRVAITFPNNSNLGLDGDVAQLGLRPIRSGTETIPLDQSIGANETRSLPLGHLWKNIVVNGKPVGVHSGFQTKFVTGNPPPVPAQIRIQAFMDNKATPSFDKTFNLVQAKFPLNTIQNFRYPFAGGDLRPDEYYWSNSDHEDGYRGEQDYNYDGVTIGYNRDLSPRIFTTSREKTDTANNGGWSAVTMSSRHEGKPVRAMAHGIVVRSFVTMDENSVPNPDLSGVNFNEKTYPSGGNLVELDHGGGLHSIYCHMQTGSTPAELQAKGARVWSGQEIGRAGFSGNATGPHTHVGYYYALDEVDPTTNPNGAGLRCFPIPFTKCKVVDLGELRPDDHGAEAPWYALDGEGLPNTDTAIFPGTTAPGTQRRVQGLLMDDDGSPSTMFFTYPDEKTFRTETDKLINAKIPNPLLAMSVYADRINDLDNAQYIKRYAALHGNNAHDSEYFFSDDADDFVKQCQHYVSVTSMKICHLHTWRLNNHQYFFGIVRRGLDVSQQIVFKDSFQEFRDEVQNKFNETPRKYVRRAIAWPEWKFLWSGVRWIGVVENDGTTAGLHHSTSPSIDDFKKWLTGENEIGYKPIWFTSWKDPSNLQGPTQFWGITRNLAIKSEFYDTPDMQTFEEEYFRFSMTKTKTPTVHFLAEPFHPS